MYSVITHLPAFNFPTGQCHFIIQCCSTDQSCSERHLAVYAEEHAQSTLLGRFCGQRFPWSLVSTGSQLHIVLDTEAWRPEHRVQLHYQIIGS